MNLDEAIAYLRPIAESATVGHYAEALGLVLAAAGVTQPEPERRATLQQTVHLIKAGAWEPVPNQTGETP